MFSNIANNQLMDITHDDSNYNIISGVVSNETVSIGI